jgi:enoyl-CoA hydratase/carnithine racemase
MRQFRTLTVDEREEVATITLHTSSGNGEIDLAVLEDLETLMIWLEDERSCSLAVFRGAAGVFCRGLSPAMFGPGTTASIHAHNRWEKALVALERLPKVTLAAIDGVCGGAGVQLALACDHRLATTSTSMQLPEVKQGYLPGMALFRLTKYVGLGVARRLVLTGVPWSAADAIGWGLVDWVCEPDALAATLEHVTEQILPTNGDTVRLARRLLNESFAEPIEDVLGSLLAAQHRCLSRMSADRASEDRSEPV